MSACSLSTPFRAGKILRRTKKPDEDHSPPGSTSKHANSIECSLIVNYYLCFFDFKAFFLASLATDKAIAMDCSRLFPDLISVEIFFDMVFEL